MGLPPRQSLDALLLDLDDTILDNRYDDRGPWQAAASLLGHRLPGLHTADLVDALVAESDWFWSDPGRERRGRLDIPAARRKIVAAVLARRGFDGTHCEEAVAVYAERREGAYRLFAGARAALSRLRTAFPRMAIVTNGAAEPQRRKIERFALAGFFDHVQVEGEFGLGKPEPAVFRHAARCLEVSPERCLMVGDNYRCDVLGALGAGAHAAWVSPGGAPPALPPRPHATVRSLVELTERLLGPADQGPAVQER